MREESNVVEERTADQNGCITCRYNRDEIVPLGGVIYQSDLWRLEHMSEPLPMVGWLVLKPMRHVEHFAELTKGEAETFGPLTRRITRTMTEVLQPVKIYLSMYMEAQGFAHLHVHLIPRFADTPQARRGTGVFDYLRECMKSGRNLADPAEAVRCAEALRLRL